jgi:type VI protein secretion system component Hcp
MKNHGFTLALCSTLLAMPLAAQAANDMFLRIEGIPGSSTSDKYKDAIELDSFSWGLTVTPASGGMRDPMPVVSFEDLVWTQPIDKAVPMLMEKAGTGAEIGKATLDLVRPGLDKPYAYLSMVFEDILLTGVSISNSSGEAAEVEASFAYKALTMTVRVQDKNGTLTDHVGKWKMDARGSAAFTGSSVVFLQMANLEQPVDPDLVPSIPEPQSYALLLAGLGLVGWAARRRTLA